MPEVEKQPPKGLTLLAYKAPSFRRKASAYHFYICLEWILASGVIAQYFSHRSKTHSGKSQNKILIRARQYYDGDPPVSTKAIDKV